MEIKFIQDSGKGVDPFVETFETFDDVKEWILEDKRTGYGDVLLYGGKFQGLTPEQVEEVEGLTLEDAIKDEI